jgi:hypothetical protein
MLQLVRVHFELIIVEDFLIKSSWISTTEKKPNFNEKWILDYQRI